MRHAQASFGAEDYDVLSDVGERQAAVLGAALRARLPSVDLVVAGRMRRHRRTAEACLDAMGAKAPVVEDAGWDEYDHRDVIRAAEPRHADHAAMLEDLLAADDPRRAFQQMFSRAVERWASGLHDADYREPWPAFRARVDAALARAVEAPGAPERTLVFTSGGPILAACASLLRIPTGEALRLGWGLANASVTKLVVGSTGARVSSLNEHGHFSGEHAGLLTFR
ncbi:MAG TPA: histidine phosphatase family protein [Candidatus Thermoplasmatota archaeon]|nr:histidine phosphatase family protein [Candidatus Thermoplasmatota archaeon]